MNEPTCEVCGAPLAKHTMALRDGVAQTIGRDGLCCSGVSGDREYTRGQIAQMLTIVRSLRYMAGRLANAGWRQQSAALRDYSEGLADRREKLCRDAAKWYPWGTA